MKKGTVKFFNESKGYGFVAPEEGGKDAFVHFTTLRKYGIESLKENDYVQFTTEMNNGKERVSKIEKIS